jgi:hypothetical protein
MPAGLGVGGGALAGESGAVVVVVMGTELVGADFVGAEVVVVVDPLEGGVVVVVVVVVLLVVVVVLLVVVVVLLVVVVVVLLEVVVVGAGAVVVVVDVGVPGAVVVVPAAAVGVPAPTVGVTVGTVVVVVVPGVAPGAGSVIVTAVHAPAVCIVATSAINLIRARSSVVVSVVNLTTARWSALAAWSRRASAARSAADASWVRANTSDVATFSYCCATTPLGLGGMNTFGADEGLVYEVLTYSPLFTYSSTAKLPSARWVAANLARMEDASDCAAPACLLFAVTSLLSFATAIWATCQPCRSDVTFEYTSTAVDLVSTSPTR